MQVERLLIADLHYDPANVRKHNERNLQVIRSSLARFGQQRPILVDGSNVVRAGNGTLQAARELGWESILCVRTDLTGSEAIAYAIADNRSAELAEWEDGLLGQQLQGLLDDGIDLDAVGFSEDEIDALVKELADDGGMGSEGDEAPEPELDKAEELLEKWKVKTGQLWLIPSLKTPRENHRLLCGDSTKPKDAATAAGGAKVDLVWTDPPYGVAYVGKTKDALEIENDSLDEAGLDNLLTLSLAEALVNARPGAAVYVASPSGPLQDVFAQVLRRLGIRRQTLAWVKDVFVLGHSDYHYRHETLFYGWKPGKRHEPPTRDQDSVWEIPRPKRSEEHLTMKPVELVARSLRNSSEPGDLVYDPFCGSGTTIIAAEQLGRLACAVELAPKYVAVILERLSQMGLTPTLQAVE